MRHITELLQIFNCRNQCKPNLQSETLSMDIHRIVVPSLVLNCVFLALWSLAALCVWCMCWEQFQNWFQTPQSSKELTLNVTPPPQSSTNLLEGQSGTPISLPKARRLGNLTIQRIASLNNKTKKTISPPGSHHNNTNYIVNQHRLIEAGCSRVKLCTKPHFHPLYPNLETK